MSQAVFCICWNPQEVETDILTRRRQVGEEGTHHLLSSIDLPAEEGVAQIKNTPFNLKVWIKGKYHPTSTSES